MTDGLLETALETALEAALAAGRVLLAARAGVVAAGPEGARTKSSDSDPVTRADTAAQQAIVSVIAAARPGDALTGEEGLSSPGSSGWRWIIDPLDGTVNYLYGRDDWAVSIAAADEAGTAVAVVHAPALGRTYTAVRGGGAWFDGMPLAVRPARDLARSIIGTGFSYAAAGRALQAAVLTRLLPRVADLRRSGSAALDLAAVASGALDAFYEDDLETWDWAAGALLAAEAGAAVCPLAGPGGRGGILAAAPGLSEELLSLIFLPETGRLG